MVLVYSDNKNLTFELLGKGSELAKELGTKLTATIIGKSNDNLVKEYIAYGADKVVVAESDIDLFKVEEYTELLGNVVKEIKAGIILIGSSKNGKELASRLAGRINAGCVIDSISLYVKDKKLTVERVVYSGNAIAVEQFNSTPNIVTIPPKVFKPLSKDEKRTGEIVKKKFDVEKSNSKVLKVQDMQTGDVNVEEAEIIVSCGRGFKKKEDIKLLGELAEVLKGRTVGCSRCCDC